MDICIHTDITTSTLSRARCYRAPRGFFLSSAHAMSSHEPAQPTETSTHNPWCTGRSDKACREIGGANFRESRYIVGGRRGHAPRGGLWGARLATFHTTEKVGGEWGKC
eukprot:1762033-Pleurochrysis_carterae.AAC.1